MPVFDHIIRGRTASHPLSRQSALYNQFIESLSIYTSIISIYTFRYNFPIMSRNYNTQELEMHKRQIITRLVLTFAVRSLVAYNPTLHR
jgi:hypothetical protein